jgi:TolB-like protein
MLNRLRWILALGILLTYPLALSAQTEDTRPGIAVMQFENAGSHGDDAEADDFAAFEVGLQSILTSELSQNAALRIVERRALQAVLDEQDLAVQGRVDANTAARIGRLIGVRYMILGSFVDIFEQMRMDARVVDVETGELLRARGIQAEREQVLQIVADLAAAITEGLELPALEVEEAEAAPQQRELPIRGVALFSRAIRASNEGRTDEARELLQEVTSEWPNFVPAQEELRQLPTG